MAAAALPGLIVFGNCQAGPLAAVLRRLPGIGSRFQITAVSSFDMAQNRPARFLEAIDMAGVVLLLGQRETAAALPAWLTGVLPPRAGVVQFAAMDTGVLWPFHARDPRNRPEPGHPFGRYPYGDRLVIELMAGGLTGAALFDEYWRRSTAEVSGLLPGLRRQDEARLRARDAMLDVGIGDIVLDQMGVQPLFNTFNHPTGWLFRQLAGRLVDAVCRALGLPGGADEVRTRLPNFDPLRHEQVPIHPAIARRLGLAWWQAGQTYRRPDGEMLNFRQYMRRYMDFT